jgi:hypothetical protein
VPKSIREVSITNPFLPQNVKKVTGFTRDVNLRVEI